jgi:hypothetical protein
MSVEEQHTVTERRYVPDHAAADPDARVVSRHEVVTTRPTAVEFARRLLVLVFGLVQLVIALRIVLLLVGARESSLVVAWVMAVSGVLVAPFAGILQTNAVKADGSVFDLAAVAALVGWTVLEAVAVAAIGIFGSRS